MTSSYVTQITESELTGGNTNLEDRKIDISPNTTVFREVEEYIEQLNAGNRVPADDVFSPFIAKMNSIFLGMNYFGCNYENMDSNVELNEIKNKNKNPAITSYKYFGFHLYVNSNL